MSDEEKILSMLTKMQNDVDALKVEVDSIKNNDLLKTTEKHKSKSTRNTYEALMAMSELLTQDEKDALGEYMAAEEARKVALYG